MPTTCLRTSSSFWIVKWFGPFSIQYSIVWRWLSRLCLSPNHQTIHFNAIRALSSSLENEYAGIFVCYSSTVFYLHLISSKSVAMIRNCLACLPCQDRLSILSSSIWIPILTICMAPSSSWNIVTEFVHHHCTCFHLYFLQTLNLKLKKLFKKRIFLFVHAWLDWWEFNFGVCKCSPPGNKPVTRLLNWVYLSILSSLFHRRNCSTRSIGFSPLFQNCCLLHTCLPPTITVMWSG